MSDIFCFSSISTPKSTEVKSCDIVTVKASKANRNSVNIASLKATFNMVRYEPGIAIAPAVIGIANIKTIFKEVVVSSKLARAIFLLVVLQLMTARYLHKINHSLDSKVKLVFRLLQISSKG